MVIGAFVVLQWNAVWSQTVMINQVGYLPDQQKKFYAIAGADSFSVTDVNTGAVAYRGTLQTPSGKDPSTGFYIYAGDFSPLTTEGTYKIYTDAPDSSYQFSISRSVFESVYKASLKGYYFQRCGTSLLSQNAGVYARSTCHVNDGTYHSTTGLTGTKVTTGGWHDAGDYGKYVVNAGISVGTLLLAYEMFPDKFKYDDLNIPESGNSVPDILDESKYELDWLLEMQDTTDGGVYFKVTTENFDGFEMPSSDLSTRYIYQKSTTATGDFAAVMALAARLFQQFDTAYASRCLNASRLAWQHLEAKPTIVPTGGFHNPSGTGTGEYGDGSDSDERLWASAELFVTTGDTLYHNYFKSHYNSSGIFASTMGWADVRSMGQLEYLIGGQSKADTSVQSQLKVSLLAYCSALSYTAEYDGLNVTLTPSQYYWGSNGQVLNNAVLLIAGYVFSGDTTYYNTALEQLNYILGCNARLQTYVTGIGSKSPLHIHHRPSAADGIAAPVPGLMSGGPDEGLDDAVLKADYTSTTPPARCYVDDQNSYASNEIAINWNAPLVFVSGYLNQAPATPVAQAVRSIPLKYNLSQNYPNPFNPSTVIGYDLPTGGKVSLKVYDILGREVATLVSGARAAGHYDVTFDGSRLPSGVYFFRLSAGQFGCARKMVLLK